MTTNTYYKSMRAISNVEAAASYVARDSSSVYIAWNKNGCRYHVWINERNGKVEPITKLFKNPPDGIKSGQPGYFSTRILKPFNAANKADVEYALRVGDVERAKSDYLAKEAREKEEREQDARDRKAREKLNAAAPDLLALVQEALEVYQTIDNGSQQALDRLVRVRAAIAEAQP